jgi:uncharacterized protein (TIGR02246 family)
MNTQTTHWEALMNSIAKFAVLMVLAALWASVTFAQGTGELTLKNWQQAAKQYEEAFNKGDVASLIKYYADDAVVIPQDEEVAKGRQAIQGLLSGEVKALTNLQVKVESIEQVAPELAYETGAYTMQTKETKDQPSQKLEGKYGILWRKSGDNWLMLKEIASYKLPQQGSSQQQQTK